MTKAELSHVKRQLFNMLAAAGKFDNPDHINVIEAIDELTFKKFSLDNYASTLIGIINEMLELDDIAFDVDQLNNYLSKLTQA